MSFAFDGEKPKPTPQERLARINEIRKALKEGYIGTLVGQRDFWRQATADVLGELDVLIGNGVQVAGMIELMMQQAALVAEKLDGWLEKHGDEPGSAVIAQVRELIKATRP